MRDDQIGFVCVDSTMPRGSYELQDILNSRVDEWKRGKGPITIHSVTIELKENFYIITIVYSYSRE